MNRSINKNLTTNGKKGDKVNIASGRLAKAIYRRTDEVIGVVGNKITETRKKLLRKKMQLLQNVSNKLCGINHLLSITIAQRNSEMGKREGNSKFIQRKGKFVKSKESK